MAVIGNLTVYILDQNSNLAASQSFTKIDFAACRPIDIIQILYQKGFKVTKPGGTTIWKMGKCIAPPKPPVQPNPVPGQLLAESTFFTDPVNNVQPGDQVVIVEVPM